MVVELRIEPNDKLFETLESMGDFFIVPKSVNNSIILHTKLSKTIMINKIKKISNESFNVIIVNDNNISNYPALINSWYKIDELEKKLGNINEKEVEKDALHKLNDFVDFLEKELKDSAGKEVVNCQIK